MSEHVLPDSRLAHRPDFGTFMADWPLPDGTSVRVEVCPIFCGNCGKLYGYCPRENTTFAFWLCRSCHETYGDVAGTYAVPDEEFCKTVQYEMERRFGRALTDFELLLAAENGDLGTALEKLALDSPYPCTTKRAKG